MSNYSINLQGKVALITGASRGIGRAITEAFVANGAKVMMAARNEATLKAVSAELGGSANGVEYVCMDMKDSASIQNAVSETVKRFGRLDLAVNNAGIQTPGAPIINFNENAYDELMAVNLKGMFTAMKHQITAMLPNPNGGAIVNISSALGIVAVPMAAPYVASKHAISGLTKSAALEYAGQKIRINVVAPGIVDTELFWEGPGSTPESLAAVTAKVPMGQIAKTEQIACAVVWLCSDTASYVTGITLPVDGGFSL